VFVHPLAGVLSAYGMGLADQIAMREASLEQPLDDAGLAAARASAWCNWATRPPPRWPGQGVDPVPHHAPRSKRRCTCATRAPTPRWWWTSASAGAAIAEPTSSRLPPALRLPDAGRALVIEAVSVEAVAAGRAPRAKAGAAAPCPRVAPRPDATCACTDGSGSTPACSCARTLRAGATIDGPAIIAERQRHHRGRARLAPPPTPRRPDRAAARAPRATQHAIGTEADPVMLEVFNNLFMNIAEQMGLRLQNTAYSVNIKERLDFSCALFDADGRADRQRAAHAGAPGR
jgi:5-oxoprolinase (ATP-hydrolysing)